MNHDGLLLKIRQSGPIALDAVIDCPPGELLALVGPSGSGKTTLLRSIAGLYHPAEGSIVCNGEVWFDRAKRIDRSPQQRTVGFVFQHFALFPHRTVSDNIALAMPRCERAQRSSKVAELLQRVHLDGLGKRLPQQLSGGQQQRVALARALAREPKILLLDEPFSSVDQVTRRKLRLEMMQLARSVSIPIILVTHDLDEAAMLADRISVLHGGTTHQQDRPEVIFERPASATVARLVDIRNLFEGRVVAQLADQAVTRFEWGGVEVDCRYRADLTIGERVCWLIPPSGILLHSRLRPSLGERENPFSGRIVMLAKTTTSANLVIELNNPAGIRLHMDLPPHVVTRNALKTGEQVKLSLLKRSVHLLPWEPLGGSPKTD